MKERSRWQAYARLFYSRCHRRPIDKEWWATIHDKVQDFLTLLDTNFNKYFHRQMKITDNYKN